MAKTVTIAAWGLGALVVGGVLYFGFLSRYDLTHKEEWQNRDQKLGELDARLKELSSKIQDLQGQSVCEDDGDCRVVGLGTKVCDEYKDYLVYSVKDANEEKLLGAVDEFNSVHHKLADLSLAAETCGRKPARIVCVDKTCTPEKP